MMQYLSFFDELCLACRRPYEKAEFLISEGVVLHRAGQRSYAPVYLFVYLLLDAEHCLIVCVLKSFREHYFNRKTIVYLVYHVPVVEQLRTAHPSTAFNALFDQIIQCVDDRSFAAVCGGDVENFVKRTKSEPLNVG